MTTTTTTTNIYVVGRGSCGGAPKQLMKRRRRAAFSRAEAMKGISSRAARVSNTPLIPTRGAPRVVPLVELDGRRKISNFSECSIIVDAKAPAVDLGKSCGCLGRDASLSLVGRARAT